MLTAAALLALAARVPSWYQPAQATPARHALAESVEARVLSEISGAHPFGEPWTLSITDAEAAAWLNDRLPAWAANQKIDLPASASLPAARFDDDEAAVALTLRGSYGARVITLAVPLDAHRPGPISVRIGSLPLPAFIVNRAAPAVQRLALRETSNPDQPWRTIRLDDGRTVEFTAISATNGTLTIHAVTRGKR
ncbi:MAG: hypothetical protein J0L61_11300 [Planctomycetes bacterium]|nr:hypothetical protein [Planctomycetota bacterium]